MFPHVMQALHIFEPRYRAMFEEAIEDDRLIALGSLAPGWEGDYEGRPPLRPTACLCRVATHQRTEEGTYNVLVLGVRRLRLLRELPPKKLFRVVESEIIEDVEPADAPPGSAAALQQRLHHWRRQAVAQRKSHGRFPECLYRMRRRGHRQHACGEREQRACRRRGHERLLLGPLWRCL
jgi:Lon protease-like protein